MKTRIHIYSLDELAVASDIIEINFSTPGRRPRVTSGLCFKQEAVDLALFLRGLLAFSPITIRVLKLRKMKAFAMARAIILANLKDQRPVRK